MGIFKSLFVKILGIFFATVMLLFVAIDYVSISDEQANATRQTLTQAETVTELIAMQIGGAVKFSNTAAVNEILSSIREFAGEAWVDAVVIDGAGNVIYPLPDDTGAVDAAMQPIIDLAKQSLESASADSQLDSLLVAQPILFGVDNATVGAIATAWTDAPMMANLWDGLMNGLILTGTLCLAAVVMAGVALQKWMSQPLKRLQKNVSEVAAGDYDVVVHARTRTDEIGQIARELEGFRTQLKDGAQLAYDSAFKSSAYEGSSAAMMVVNTNFEVLYSNPACNAFLARLGADLTSDWTGLDLAAIVGANVRNMSSVSDIVSDIDTRSGAALPAKKMIAVGAHRIRVKFNAATDQNGVMNGAVIEWSDRTESQNNSALVSGIDTAMMRAEFGSNGRLLSANDNFLSSLGLSSDAVGTAQFSHLFDPEGAETENPLAEESVTGRIQFKGQNGTGARVTDGSFMALKGLDGQVEKSLFVGMDVTEADMNKRAAERAKQQSDEEQHAVVSALGAALNDLAAGRLNADIHQPFTATYEELRNNYNGALQALRDAFAKVAMNTDSIRSEATEITTAADDLSKRTEKQAATLEETAAALDELTSSVRSAADGAKSASEKASAAHDSAEQGGHIAREAVDAMDGIKSSSQEISKITSVIDDIAFQTNLLALNAGVEAARAGDAGRGFAVVATEVRALAQRSSEAAREINTLISTSEHQVQAGVDLVDKTGVALSAIVASISEISKLVANIAVSTGEQASGLNEVNSAVNELDQVTQQNAAMFEETTAASHALTTEADALAVAVSQFDLGEAGSVDRGAKKSATASIGRKDGATPISEQQAAPRQKAASTVAVAEFEDDDGWEDF